MIFRGASVARASAQRLVAQARLKSTLAASKPTGSQTLPGNVLQGWYSSFGKSSALYASWVVMFIVVGEFAFGKITDGLWTMNNYGKTYNTVDWSRFDVDDDDEEGGEEEEEEGGDDDDDE